MTSQFENFVVGVGAHDNQKGLNKTKMGRRRRRPLRNVIRRNKYMKATGIERRPQSSVSTYKNYR